MAFGKIFKKSEKAKAPTKKGKKGKKQETLVSQMGLSESVASAVIDTLNIITNEEASPVQETTDGFLIVALTNAMLEEAELDPKGEDFGAFAEALQSEVIESVTLASDLAEGVIGIIPSGQSLEAMDEQPFLHDLEFKWAIVPHVLDDDDRLTLLEGTVTYAELTRYHENDTPLQVVDGRVEEGGSVSSGQDEVAFDDEDDFVETSPADASTDDMELDMESIDDVLVDDYDEDYDDLDTTVGNDEDAFDFDDADDYGVEDTYEEPSDDAYDDVPYDESVDTFDDVAVEEDIAYDEPHSSEDAKERLNAATKRLFYNDELDLSVDMNVFDMHFNSDDDRMVLPQFDETVHQDTELYHVLAKMRQDANAELKKFHRDEINKLRNRYSMTMGAVYSRLVQAVDYKDEQTKYGQRHRELLRDFETFKDNMDVGVRKQMDELKAEYNRKREDHGNRAKQEAMNRYDDTHKDALDKELSTLRDHKEALLQVEHDKQLGDLYEDRRLVAKRSFDKSTNDLLIDLNEEFKHIAERELQMYDTFRKNMDAYLRRHFADDVLKAKAEAEKLRQSHEAEEVRQKYEELLDTKTRQLDEARDREQRLTDELKSDHKKEISWMISDYERRLSSEASTNEELRELIDKMSDKFTRLHDNKDAEIEHQLKVLENALSAKERELEYANTRSSRPYMFISIALAVVGVALGLVFGFIFASESSFEEAPASTNTTETTTSYDDVTVNSIALWSDLIVEE